MNYNEDFTLIHDSINGDMLIAFILKNTIYIPNNGNHINMVYDVNSLRWYSLFYLVRLGLVERKTLNEKYILSDKGFEFLLWMKENYFKEIIRAFDATDCKYYIDLLIKKEDLALALSITRNPDKWKFLGDSYDNSNYVALILSNFEPINTCLSSAISGFRIMGNYSSP